MIVLQKKLQLHQSQHELYIERAIWITRSGGLAKAQLVFSTSVAPSPTEDLFIDSEDGRPPGYSAEAPSGFTFGALNIKVTAVHAASCVVCD